MKISSARTNPVAFADTSTRRGRTTRRLTQNKNCKTLIGFAIIIGATGWAMLAEASLRLPDRIVRGKGERAVREIGRGILMSIPCAAFFTGNYPLIKGQTHSMTGEVSKAILVDWKYKA